jgi:hypothetical protein
VTELKFNPSIQRVYVKFMVHVKINKDSSNGVLIMMVFIPINWPATEVNICCDNLINDERE